MRRILGCDVPDRVLESWAGVFAFDPEPVYLTEAWSGVFGSGVEVPSRPEFEAGLRDRRLDFRDAYRTWAIKRDEAPFVALVGPETWRACAKETRDALARLQADLGRGLVFDWQVFDAFDAPGSARDLLEPDAFEHRRVKKFILHADAWHQLPREVQFDWLGWFVSDDTPACVSSQLEEGSRRKIVELVGPEVMRLLGSFEPVSGGNCFGTVLAAVTRDPSWASRWLQADAMAQALVEHSYCDLGTLSTRFKLESGSVLVWQQSGGRIVHACFCLGDGLVFNKDSQCWWAPRCVLPLERMLERWADEPAVIRVYARSKQQ